MKKNKSKAEFRKANAKGYTGHPSYIFKKVGDDYEFIGITHAEITNGVKNILLEKNPNPKDKEKSYLRPKTDKAHKATFGERLVNWRFSDKDKPKVKQVVEKNKKKK